MAMGPSRISIGFSLQLLSFLLPGTSVPRNAKPPHNEGRLRALSRIPRSKGSKSPVSVRSRLLEFDYRAGFFEL
jgi:hypothetical protein